MLMFLLPVSCSFALTQCSYVVNEVDDFYVKQHSSCTPMVKWNSTSSECCSCNNVIKQVGVLSPDLFCVYTDELLNRSETSHVGCHIGHQFMGDI